MENEKQVKVNLNVNINELEGKFANVFQVSTSGSESRLDCVFIDKAVLADNGEMLGKVVSRVMMTTDSLIELRELLDRHIDGLLAPKGVDDAGE